MNFAKFCSVFAAASLLLSLNAGPVLAEGWYVKKHSRVRPANPVVKTPFTGKWQIQSIKGSPTIKGIRGTYPQIEFIQGGINGQSGCNGFGGSMDLTDTKMKFGLMRSTQMACPDLIMKQEQALYKALAEVQSYRYTGVKPNARMDNMAAIREVQLLDSRQRPVLTLVRK